MAVFSWTSIEKCSWVARALWYCSLSLSIWAIITSSQQGNLLRSLPSVSRTQETSRQDLDYILEAILHRSKSQDLGRHRGGAGGSFGVSHYVMLCVWQCPMMLMSYAWATFLIALTVYVCTPLINGDAWGDETKVTLSPLTDLIVRR